MVFYGIQRKMLLNKLLLYGNVTTQYICRTIIIDPDGVRYVSIHFILSIFKSYLKYFGNKAVHAFYTATVTIDDFFCNCLLRLFQYLHSLSGINILSR